MSLLEDLCGGKAPGLVLYDLDGTLADSVPDLADAVDAMLSDWNLPRAGEERVRHWVGNGSRMLVRRALDWALGQPEDERLRDRLDAAHDLFLAQYDLRFRRRTRLYPGVADCLAALSRMGIPQAVITNKPARFVAPLLEHLGIGQYLPFWLGGDSLPAKKPDPLPLLHACARFDLAPERALMVGDSRNDVAAARACGMPVVCVRYGYNHGEPLEAAAPDKIVDSLVELL